MLARPVMIYLPAGRDLIFAVSTGIVRVVVANGSKESVCLAEKNSESRESCTFSRRVFCVFRTTIRMFAAPGFNDAGSISMASLRLTIVTVIVSRTIPERSPFIWYSNEYGPGTRLASDGRYAWTVNGVVPLFSCMVPRGLNY